MVGPQKAESQMTEEILAEIGKWGLLRLAETRLAETTDWPKISISRRYN
jgi:hypothetical protein